MKTGTTRIITEIVTKTKIEIKTKTNTEMTAMTKLEVGLEKNIVYIMLEKIMVLLATIQGLNYTIKSYNS